MTNSESSSLRTGEGVVVDIGTGDGRFVSAMAKANSRKFYIGIDPNAAPLEKPSMKATRKPTKGGLPNALFIQAAAEELPEELNGAADEIHIHFPWGSLLRAVAVGEKEILASLRGIAAPDCLLEIVIGIDPERDLSEIQRLGLPEISEEYLRKSLIGRYKAAGFDAVRYGILDRDRWSEIETSWAKRLRVNDRRRVFYLVFEVNGELIAEEPSYFE